MAEAMGTPVEDPAPLLTRLLGQTHTLPAPARTPEECIVGPVKAGEGWGGVGGGNSNRTGGGTTGDDDDSEASPPNDNSSKKCGQKRPRPESDEHGRSCASSAVGHDNSSVAAPDRSTTLLPGAASAFLASGCAVLRQPVLPAHFIAECLAVANADLALLQSELSERRREAINSGSEHLLAAAARGDFREIVYRDGGRRDVRYRLDLWPWTAPGLVYNSVVYPLVRELLGGGDDVQLLYMGVMWANGISSSSGDGDGNEKNSNPASDPHDRRRHHQKWHGDGGHLFSHVHLPPHCINVFYPLVDLTTDNGPTEFRPGTHRLGKLDDPSASQFPLTCPAGGAVLFDYRTKHRGLANVTGEDRPVMYLAYAKTHFRDAGNARSGRSVLSGGASTTRIQSLPWVARVLDGEAVTPGAGFEKDGSTASAVSDGRKGEEEENGDGAPPPRREEQTQAANASQLGSGERWVLFQMNVEVPDGDGDGDGAEGDGDGKGRPPKSVALTVHHGDVPSEVAAQFCRAQGLAGDFVPVLAGAIRQQMDACM